MNYEGQICRAPMERSSYMLPIMVGCSYNSCRFCNLFRHLKFRALPMEEIEAEYLLEIIESARAEFLNRTKPAHIVNFSMTGSMISSRSAQEAPFRGTGKRCCGIWMR